MKNYKDQWEAKQSELAQLLRYRDGIVIEQIIDVLDEVRYATERELSIRNLDRDSNLLRNVRGPLSRIEAGSFGVYLDCEEYISAKRLAAGPWRLFCIQCQELADRIKSESADSFDESLVTDNGREKQSHVKSPKVV